MNRLSAVPPGDDYIKRHGLDGLFNDLMNRLLQDRPEEPIQYLINTLKEAKEKSRCLRQPVPVSVHSVEDGQVSMLKDKEVNALHLYNGSPNHYVNNSEGPATRRSTSHQQKAPLTPQTSYSVTNDTGTKRMRVAPESASSQASAGMDNINYYTKVAQAWSIHVDPMQLRVPKLTNFILTYSNAFGCPDEFFLIPLLSATASLMGKKAECLVTPCWKEPCVLWSAVAARRGEETTPASKKLLGELKALQKSLPVQDHGPNFFTFAALAEPGIQKPGRKLFTNFSSLDETYEVLSANESQLLCFASDLELLYEELRQKSNLDQKRFAGLHDGDGLTEEGFEEDCRTSLSFTGFVDSKSLVRHLNAECIEDLSANLLVSCPAEKDALMEDLSAVSKETPSFQDVLLLVREAHSGDAVTYEFSEDALLIARSYLNALAAKKRESAFDENRRLVVARARSHFVRLCMIVQALNGAVEAAYSRNDDPLRSSSPVDAADLSWHSSTISSDVATAAAYLTECFLLQKLTLMPEEIKLNINMHQISDGVPNPKIPVLQQEVVADSDEPVSLAYCRNRATYSALDPDELEEYYESQYPKFPENCENNIRSFVIHDGEFIHSSKVMQVHMMPPYDTPGPGKNRYAAPAAKFFMKKLANLGLGKLFRKGNKGGLIFQKKKWEELDEAARGLMEKCGVSESEYMSGKKPKTMMMQITNGDVAAVS